MANPDIIHLHTPEVGQSEDTLSEETAKVVAQKKFPATIKKDAINRLPLARYTGPIHLITTPAAAHWLVEHLSGVDVVGFDTESRPAFKRGQSFPPALCMYMHII